METAIIILKNERPKKHLVNRPLYTKEEMRDLYSIKDDIRKFPKRSKELQ